MSSTETEVTDSTVTGTSISVDKIHPSFNEPSADVTLASHEGTLFRLHSSYLCLASGWFRTLLSIPQSLATDSDTPPNPSETMIPMSESEHILVTLLSIISWKSIPPLNELGFVENLLRAGEKYEMPSVISIARLAIMAGQILDTHPIRVYGIASSRGWTAEAKLASTKTIGLDLLSPECMQDLETVDSLYMAKLLLLHRRRRELFRASALESTKSFVINAQAIYNASASSAPNSKFSCKDHTRAQVMRQAEERKWAWWGKVEQSRDVPSKALLHRPEMYGVLEMTCSICQAKLLDRDATLDKLSKVVDGLPVTVEVCCVACDSPCGLGDELIQPLAQTFQAGGPS
ncbi:hypothetical protein BDY19DRAFT_901812 [Irpex rosettiformis]|uniref:Uncharacterized protein n=1 Tax=Irpex rosettiformis TaxID=378272 RepID=A0ACB8UJY6_9APHY|nr:hypothetical protein BDY19DRAFT_901812 [Irpex rosettiformis]